MLRDLLNEDFNRIIVNDKSIYNDTRNYIRKIAPDKLDIVSYYHNGAPFLIISELPSR
jgi:ribonuclease G